MGELAFQWFLSYMRLTFVNEDWFSRQNSAESKCGSSNCCKEKESICLSSSYRIWEPRGGHMKFLSHLKPLCTWPADVLNSYMCRPLPCSFSSWCSSRKWSGTKLRKELDIFLFFQPSRLFRLQKKVHVESKSIQTRCLCRLNYPDDCANYYSRKEHGFTIEWINPESSGTGVFSGFFFGCFFFYLAWPNFFSS